MPLIYKLYDDEDCYVGSTTQTLKERLDLHIKRKNCKSTIILDRNKFIMELIEEVETNNRYEREQYWIDKLSTLSQLKCFSGKEDERNVCNILCECGVYYSPKHKARHFRSQRHLKRTDPIYIEKEKQFQEDKKKRVAEYKAQWYLKKKSTNINEERKQSN
jgi:hypothetical protein